MRATIVLAGLAAAVSMVFVAPAPSYDPWAWLIWGREVAQLGLDTAEGPAFKPLPVFVCALLSPLGDAAAWLWVLVARTGAALGVGLAFLLARELAGSAWAGLAAAAGVTASGSFLANAATGQAEGLLLGLALTAWAAFRREHRGVGVACLLACALVRVETWPFLLAAGAWAAWRRPGSRGRLALATIGVLAAWFLPEWLGSGDVLRSGARAQIPNPGQPALAARPALAALEAAVDQTPVVTWAGLVAGAVLLAGALRRPIRLEPELRPALGCAAIALAWIGLVAAMAQAGFSGEPRYSLPGVALLAIPAAVGLAVAARVPALGSAWPGRATAAPQRSAARPQRSGAPPREGAAARLERSGPLAATACALAAVVTLAGQPAPVADLAARQAYQARLVADLDEAIARVGGRDAVLSCGTPFVGPLRGPLLAHRLSVAKRRVEPDAAPAPPGMAFRSSLTRDARPAPGVPAGFSTAARAGLWDVTAHCRDGRGRAQT